MKKQLYIGLALLLWTILQASAQGVLNQNMTMQKRDLEQISLLRTYSRYLKTGYDIMKGGLRTIHDVKNSAFRLDSSYFGALKAVNPAIRKYGRVEEILKLGKQISDICARMIQEASASGVFSKEELAYLRTTAAGLLQQTREDLKQLKLMTTGGTLTLTDDERMEEIDRIYERVAGRYRTALEMAGQVTCITDGRRAGTTDIRNLNQWYGLPDGSNNKQP